MSTSADRVERMVYVALDAMERVEDSTAVEVLSAAFTITLRTLGVLMPKYPALREQAAQAAKILLMECAAGSQPN